MSTYSDERKFPAHHFCHFVVRQDFGFKIGTDRKKSEKKLHPPTHAGFALLGGPPFKDFGLKNSTDQKTSEKTFPFRAEGSLSFTELSRGGAGARRACVLCVEAYALFYNCVRVRAVRL